VGFGLKGTLGLETKVLCFCIGRLIRNNGAVGLKVLGKVQLLWKKWLGCEDIGLSWE